MSRGIGVQAYGQARKFSYAAALANSIPALDTSSQQNFSSKVAYMAHLQYDILAPYGYVETDPNGSGPDKPELTFWTSVAYNPVSAASGFQNAAAGDKTTNATATLAFRFRRFTSQSTGYYRKTKRASGLPDFNLWGFSQQAGIYIVPSRVEFAARVSGVNWGAANFPLASFNVNTWFAGPNFRYHRVDEDTLGINYYFHGHNVKFQVAYSYLYGNAFDGRKYGANRVWAQTQLMF